jgi:hypothetical protein
LISPLEDVRPSATGHSLGFTELISSGEGRDPQIWRTGEEHW